MRRFIKQLIAGLTFALCLLGTVSAASFETGWGKGLEDNDVEARIFLKNVASQICGPEDSDREKVRKLNKYVCDNAEYDYNNTSEGLADFVYKGKAICSGYGGALAYLLDCVNIKNFKVTSFVNKNGNLNALHIWNAVYIDGQWLHVDPTWNDATRSARYPDGRYFLITGAEIGVNRQKLSFNTPEEYNDFYTLIKTITISLKPADAFPITNFAKLELAQPGYGAADGSLEPSADAPSTPEGYSLQNDSITMPARETVFSLGGYVKEEGGGKITIILGTKILSMTAGCKKGSVDGEEFTFDVPPQLIDGKIMMPARTVLEKLGVTMKYDVETSDVTILYDPYVPESGAVN